MSIKKRVLFIIPPITEKIWSGYQPVMYMGVAYIARLLSDKGHDVQVLDCDVYNISLSSLKKRVKKINPDFIGLSSPYGALNNALKIASLSKKYSKARVVMGGIPATFISDYILTNCKGVDICVRGEGELTFLDIVEGKALNGINGISYLSNNKIINNPDREYLCDLDSLGLPLRDIFPLRKYRSPFKLSNSTTIETSRGCPYGCDFCIQQSKEGRKLRLRSPEMVLKELITLSMKYGYIKIIMFVDNDFLTNSKHAEDILNLIIKNKLNKRFCFMFSTRVDNLSRKDYKFFRLLKKANVTVIFFGMESLSDRYINEIGKIKNEDTAIRMLKTLEKIGIEPLPSYIIGYPDETKKDIKKTLKFAKSLNTRLVNFNILTPYPGTVFFDKAKKNNLMLPCLQYNNLDNAHQVTKHKLNLEKEFKKAHRGYILSFGYFRKIDVIRIYKRENKGRLLFFLYYIVFKEAAVIIRFMKRKIKKLVFKDNCFEK